MTCLSAESRLSATQLLVEVRRQIQCQLTLRCVMSGGTVGFDGLTEATSFSVGFTLYE